MEEIIFFVTLPLSMFSAWIIGKLVFKSLDKKKVAWANSAAIWAAMVSMIVIFVAIMFALTFASGGFSR